MRYIYADGNLPNSLDNCAYSTYILCRKLDIPITKTSIRQSLKAHSDFTSLLSIRDILKDYRVRNVAIKADLGNFNDFPFSFITQISMFSKGRRDGYFTVVTNYSNSKITFIHPLELKEVTYDSQSFKEIFLGYTLLVETDERSGEKDYEKKLKREKIDLFTKKFSILVLPLLSIIIYTQAMTKNGSLFPIIYTLLCLGAAFVGTLLLWSEVDQYNPVLQGICSAGKKTNCNAIVNSSAAKIFGSNCSVIGLAYFTGSLIVLLVSGILSIPVLLLLSWGNTIALTYVAFSLYCQAGIAKRWRLLSLAIQAILVLQFITALLSGFHKADFDEITMVNVFWGLVCFTIHFLVATLFKSEFQKAKENSHAKSELQQLKNSSQIFNALLIKQNSITESIGNLGINS